jgi:hypothetical protein
MKAAPSGLPKDQYWFEGRETHRNGLILATSG